MGWGERPEETHPPVCAPSGPGATGTRTSCSVLLGTKTFSKAVLSLLNGICPNGLLSAILHSLGLCVPEEPGAKTETLWRQVGRSWLWP